MKAKRKVKTGKGRCGGEEQSALTAVKDVLHSCFVCLIALTDEPELHLQRVFFRIFVKELKVRIVDDGLEKHLKTQSLSENVGKSATKEMEEVRR